MNTAITINGRVYALHQRFHTESIEPLRATSRGLTGKSIVQDFGAADVALDVELLVYLDNQAPLPTFGTVSDLVTAWGVVPVSITDIDGVNADYIPSGKLDLSRQFSIVDQAAPFVVRLQFEGYHD